MPLGFILYDSSLYLQARFNWSRSTLGYVLWIPPFGWEAGYFFWGFAVDRLGPKFRRLMLAAVILSLPLGWMHSLSTGGLVLGDMFLTMFGLAGFVVLSVAYATRAFPLGHSGLVAGIGAGSWGAIVALMMPWFGRLFDQSNFAAAFRVATLFPIAGYLIWLVLSGPQRQFTHSSWKVAFNSRPNPSRSGKIVDSEIPHVARSRRIASTSDRLIGIRQRRQSLSFTFPQTFVRPSTPRPKIVKRLRHATGSVSGQATRGGPDAG